MRETITNESAQHLSNQFYHATKSLSKTLFEDAMARYQMALHYIWGRQDESDTFSTNEAITFAALYGLYTVSFYTDEHVFSLPPVKNAYEAWLETGNMTREDIAS